MHAQVLICMSGQSRLIALIIPINIDSRLPMPMPDRKITFHTTHEKTHTTHKKQSTPPHTNNKYLHYFGHQNNARERMVFVMLPPKNRRAIYAIHGSNSYYAPTFLCSDASRVARTRLFLIPGDQIWLRVALRVGLSEIYFYPMHE